ncbi:MAG: hypothetical protein QOD92_4317 [Acidimicrobiaceae bacterium]
MSLQFAISATGSEPVSIVLSVSGLAHDLDGTPQFPDDAAPALRVDPASATLVPGTPLTVRVTGSIPDGTTALYAGLVTAIDKAPTAGGVDVVTRIGVPLLLRGPQPWHPAAAIDDVALPSTAPDQPPRIEAVIRNTGDIHIRPTGTFTVLKDGQVVGTAALHGEVVLPGLARRLGVAWSPPAGLQGPLTVRLDLDDPPATFQRDGVPYPPPAAPATTAGGATSGSSDQSQQPLGGRGADSKSGDSGFVIATIIALLLIIGVAVGAVLLSRRSSPGAQTRRPS